VRFLLFVEKFIHLSSLGEYLKIPCPQVVHHMKSPSLSIDVMRAPSRKCFASICEKRLKLMQRKRRIKEFLIMWGS
jgi:hypothetical protein